MSKVRASELANPEWWKNPTSTHWEMTMWPVRLIVRPLVGGGYKVVADFLIEEADSEVGYSPHGLVTIGTYDTLKQAKIISPDMLRWWLGHMQKWVDAYLKSEITEEQRDSAIARRYKGSPY